MSWTELDTWIAITAMLSAIACALPGCFLVLRKMSMMGDAISHAVLPGLAVAFLLTHQRDSLTMFIGAATIGVLTAVFVDWVNRLGGVEESAAMGVVFTTLFALGLILLVRGADHVDLDPSCVLYGAVELVPMDTRDFLGATVPRAVVNLSAVLGLNLLFIGLFFKELQLSTFDPALADTLGISSWWMNMALMASVAVTAVAAFESVGSILVIAMLIVPAATAQLLTDRLTPMLVVAVGVAGGAAWLGHLSAITVPRLFGFEDTNTAGMMAVVAGGIFFLAVFLAPKKGILSRFLYQLDLSLKVIREDVLGMLYRLEEEQIDEPALTTDEGLEKALSISGMHRFLTVRGLCRQGLLERSDNHYYLTEAGRDRARRLVRSHRMWELYLHQFLGKPLERLHDTAHKLEHSTDETRRRQLHDELGRPDSDPHGKPIPPE